MSHSINIYYSFEFLSQKIISISNVHIIEKTMIQNFICMYYLLYIYFFMQAAQGIKNQKKCKPQTHLCKEHIEHLIRRLKKSNGEKRAPNYILFCLSLILNYILRKKLQITYNGWKNNSPLFSIEKAMLQ